MKIVIDIPEEEYDEIISSEDCGLHTLTRAVAKGTPLSKGHGRLVDEKDLSLTTVHLIDGKFVCDAPTIIEADGSVTN